MAYREAGEDGKKEESEMGDCNESDAKSNQIPNAEMAWKNAVVEEEESEFNGSR